MVPEIDIIEVVMTEEMETNIELLFDTIIEAMNDEKLVDAGNINKFVKAYFDARDKGRDELMSLFRSWVYLKKKKVGG